MIHFQQALALAVCIFRQVKARTPVLCAHLAGGQPAVGMGGQQAVEVVEDVEVGDPERQPAVGMEPLLDPEQAGAPVDPEQGRPCLGRSTDV